MIQKTLNWLAPWKAGGLRWLHWAFLHATVNTLLILVLVLVTAGVSFEIGRTVERHNLHGGGYVQGPLPPAVQVIGGGTAPPRSHWLSKFMVRLHNQGAAFSCVWQTISEIVEIEHKEGGLTAAYSPGFGWNQLNGGNPYQGVQYADSFNILQNEGDPQLSAVHLDGTVADSAPYYPTQADLDRARPNRFYTWHVIALNDRASIEREIAAGNPIAWAAPWPYQWANHIGAAPLGPNYGVPLYWHSVAITGYGPAGARIVNSEPYWGDSHQEATVPWDVLAASGGALVVAYPTFSNRPAPRVKKAAKPFPLQTWTAWTTKHHKPVLAYGAHHHLLRVGWAFANLKGAHRWGSPETRAYDRRHHLMVWRWTRGTLYVYLKYKHLPLKFQAGKR